MTFSDDLTALEGIVQTVGLTLDPPMTDVCLGLPVPRGRCIRIYWDGEAEPVRMPQRLTLNSELTADRVVIRAMWPVASADEAAHAGRIVEMAALGHGVREAIDADQALGQSLDAVEVGYAEPDIIQIGGAIVAIVDIPVTLSYRETEIA